MTAEMVKGSNSAKGGSTDASEQDQLMPLRSSITSTNEKTDFFVKSEINLVGG